MTTIKYRVTDPVTLRGEPAGPGLDNFLSYSDGDIVLIVDETGGYQGDEDGVVLVAENAARMGEQEMDRSSLQRVFEATSQAQAA